jgi:O-antigen ligase
MIKYTTNEKINQALLLNILLFTPIIFYKSSSDTYLFIKFSFISLNMLLLLFINSLSFKKIIFQNISRQYFLIPFILFIISSGFSIINIINYYDYFFTVIIISILFILQIFIAAQTTQNSIFKNLFVLIVSSLIVSIYGILQYCDVGFIGHFDFIPAKDYYNLVMHPSTLGHDNFAGEFISTIIPFILISLIFSFIKRNITLTVFTIISLPIVLSYLVITQSRSAWLGFISSIIIMLPMIFSKINSKKKLKFFGITLLIVIFITSILTPIFFNEINIYKSKFISIFNLDDNPIKFRLFLWSSTLIMIKKYFPFGIGAGNFKFYYPLFRNPQEIKTSGPNIMVDKTHNDYLQIASEFGPLGLFAFFWLIVASYKCIFSTLKNMSLENSKSHYLFLIGATGSLTANLVQSFFGFSLQNPASGMLFFVSLGIISALYQKNES